MWTVPRGVFQTPVTPLTADGSIDFDTFEKLVDFHVRQEGAAGLALPMHIGESLNLTVDERQQLLETAVRVTAGRVPVLAHVSMPGTPQTIELARHAEKAGTSAVISISPYYWRPSQDAQFDHFVALATATELPVLAYSSIKHLFVELSPSLLARLIQRLPNFVGLKDASIDLDYFTEVCRTVLPLRPSFGLIAGVEYLMPTMVVGGTGSMSALGGVAPRLVRDLYAACAAGEYERARPLQWKASQLWHLIGVDYPATIKAAMEVMGRPVGPTRLPIRPLDETARRRLREQLEMAGVLEQEPRGW
ncbi:MAG: dihydrodipicolinate synthase family protein [Chloroflexi bacterium]|nr:dihydrodipicolinate synthase family protein [Chloroflexota bacterium]